MTSKDTTANKTFCENCSLSCGASDCECVCHTQNRAFNYGYKQGMKDERQRILNILKEDTCNCEDCKDRLRRINNDTQEVKA